MGTENTLELSEAEALQEERNERLLSAIELYVAHCGGDVARATDAQRERLADAFSTWILTSEAG